MLKLIFFFGFIYLTCNSLACIREPSIYHSKVHKTPGDNGYQIKINENPKKYMPGKLYTLYLMGGRSDRLSRFTRFIINVESTEKSEIVSPQNVGSFQLYGDKLLKFNEDCINTISEVNIKPKTEVFFMWSAPPPGSGCVTFRAMVYEDPTRWFSDDGGLSKTFCEQTDEDMAVDINECCACDEAKYNMIFEGIWSNKTHPKDFPFSLWLTHFSDVIGASHERNFTFWGEGQIASEGFRSLAEWGSVRLMETELKAKSKFLRTIIKAPGLWYPNVNTNTSTKFKVDRRHNLISLASMLGPTPDWVVGVSGFNLCLKNCTWMDELVLDLYPYDAGTDSGISYMSPNAETNPRERMYRITTTYPEDPRAPFYDPTKKEMQPLAKLYLKREQLIPKNCDDSFLNAQLDISDAAEEADTRAECAVSEYTDWSPCSVSCGKGLRMRTREYRLPQKAAMFNCKRQLISKEMCVADVPECERSTGDVSDEIDDRIEDDLDNTSGVCSTTPWGFWSSCSVTCGVGFKMRTRMFVDKMGMKKCPHITTTEKEKCMQPECTGVQRVEPLDPMCPTTDWSDWSPCSASCGPGVRIRTRLLLLEPDLQHKCLTRVKLTEKNSCVDTPDCKFDMDTAKEVCMQESEQGPCPGAFQRWYFESRKLMCLPFMYGGCRGNRNNFFTSEECNSQCSVVQDLLRGPSLTQMIPVPQSSNRFDSDDQYDQNSNPVDCIVSNWSHWSPCSASCGVGTKEISRTIERPAKNGGKVCPKRLRRRRKCEGPPCF